MASARGGEEPGEGPVLGSAERRGTPDMPESRAARDELYRRALGLRPVDYVEREPFEMRQCAKHADQTGRRREADADQLERAQAVQPVEHRPVTPRVDASAPEMPSDSQVGEVGQGLQERPPLRPGHLHRITPATISEED